MTWILILTIFGGEGSAAIASVPGFDSKAICEIAGKAWDSGISSGFLSGRRTAFVCVQQKLPAVEKK